MSSSPSSSPSSPSRAGGAAGDRGANGEGGGGSSSRPAGNYRIRRSRQRGRYRHQRRRFQGQVYTSSAVPRPLLFSAAAGAGASSSTTYSEPTTSSIRRPRASLSSSSPSSPSSSLEAAAGVNGDAADRGGFLPEPFVESLALRVALDSFVSAGRLAAAPALALLFQVCSTWCAVTGSEQLWQTLTRRIWFRTRLLHPTWRDEYIYRHRIARNFRLQRYIHHTLNFSDWTSIPAPAVGDNDRGVGVVRRNRRNLNLLCVRITLSDRHVAAGFSDGSVRLFSLESHLQLRTFRPFPRDQLGQFSRSVSGIILTTLPRLTFASLDGDIHVALLHNDGLALGPATRRACLGDVVNDGALVDFTGCNRFWVGLYAGIPGRAIHIWDGESEELLYVGGTLTDPEAVMGWRTLTEWRGEFVGRVRVMGNGLAVACTKSRVLVLDLRNRGMVVGEEDTRPGLIVGSLDAADDEAFMTADACGVGRVRRARSLEEICRFSLRVTTSARGIMGCMNVGYALMCAGGEVRVWEMEHGEYLYNLRERMSEATALAVDGRHVAGSGIDGSIHVWDFGA